MPFPRLAATGRFFGRVGRLIDGIRRLVLNLVFLLVLAVVVAVIVFSKTTPLDDDTALVLDLRGALVEQQAVNARDTALAQVGARPALVNTQIRDVRDVLDAAAADPKIDRVVLRLDELHGAGLAGLREVAAALGRFRAAGKQVTAWGVGFDQRQYYLAAHADEVFLHPMGHVLVRGYGGHRNYYREALDRLGVTVNLLRVGQFKDAGEVYVADAASPASREAKQALYDSLWATYLGGVEKARKLKPGTLPALIDALPERMEAAKGNVAQLVLEHGLVDGLKTQDELRDLMIERGAKSEDGKTFRQVSFERYLAGLRRPATGDAIGVVVAEGGIVDGTAPAGTIGGASTAELIRRARTDDRIKAVVLRVNSPGGSPLGSELIRQQLDLTRAAGKPVVVSMGDIAASGGYWISMGADEVLADPATITGSIGVFALLPTAERAMEKLGVRTDGVQTNWLVAAGDPRMPLDPRFAEVLQSHLGQVYGQFTAIAAKARKTTPAAIDAVGQGRAWTGAQALERGLVDGLGGFEVAIASAAKRAKLEGTPRVAYIEPERRALDRVLGLLTGAVVHAAGDEWAARMPWVEPPAVARQAMNELGWLVRLSEGRDPFAALAHCLCTPD